jgi:hypothetical protein
VREMADSKRVKLEDTGNGDRTLRKLKKKYKEK